MKKNIEFNLSANSNTKSEKSDSFENASIAGYNGAEWVYATRAVPERRRSKTTASSFPSASSLPIRPIPP